MKKFAFLGSTIAALLHGYISFVGPGMPPDLFQLELCLAACLPYAIALGLLWVWPRQRIGAGIAVGLCLIAGLLIVVAVSTSTSSTASLDYLIAPPFKLIIVLPLAVILGVVQRVTSTRWRTRKEASEWTSE